MLLLAGKVPVMSMFVERRAEMREKRSTAMIAVVMFLLAAAAFGPGLAIAEEKTAVETNMEILAEKLKADKKLVVAANLALTDTESEAFWPLYEEYQKGLQGLHERTVKVIMAYAEAYNADTLTDEQALKLLKESMAVSAEELKMRKDLVTKLAKVLPGKKVTRYIQIENKIAAVIDYELAAEIPLVE
jgi:hypothetical protein